MKKELYLTLLSLVIICNNIFGQATTAPSNNWLGGIEYLGWDNASATPLLIQHLTPNQPIRFLNFDNNVVPIPIVRPKMELTVGGAMIDDVGNPLPNDGLRIWNPGYVGSFGFPNNGGSLDLWTGDKNTTHMRFDGGGAIHTQSNRMEIIGKRNGLWLNAAPDFNFPALNARIFFNIGTVAGGGNEYGRFSNDGLGTNIGFMRIGEQPVPATPIDAARRLEVFDAAAVPQFRITQTAGTNFADFEVNNLGDLSIFSWAGTNNRRVGINTTNPQNTLDINANGPYNAFFPSSGLRLRDMRSGSTSTTSNGKVLSVDVNGDVILVDDQGAGTLSVCGGAFTTADINYLNKISAVNTICKSSIFEDNVQNVGIGTTVIDAQLKIISSNDNTGVWCKNSSTPTSSNPLVGIRGQADGISGNYHAGGWFNAQGSTKANIGIDGYVTYTSPTAINYGGYFYGEGSAIRNFGLHANATATTIGFNVGGSFLGQRGATNYGVTGAAAGSSGTLPVLLSSSNIGGVFFAEVGHTYTYGLFSTYSGAGITCTGGSLALCPKAAGFFNGEVAATGMFFPSDIHLKTTVQDVTDGLSIINQLQPKTYNYDTAQYSFMNLNGDLQYGLVAQDLIPVLPQCLRNLGLPQEVDSIGNVVHPEVNYLGVNYTMIIPILIAGMKEQQHQIDSLANLIAQMNNGNRIQPKMQN